MVSHSTDPVHGAAQKVVDRMVVMEAIIEEVKETVPHGWMTSKLANLLRTYDALKGHNG